MTDYLQLLKSHDDAEYVESPPGFDYDVAEAQFSVMANEVVSAFPGSRFETGTEIQDASFHGQIYVALEGRIALVRVSNFGNFVTFVDDDACLTSAAADRLLNVFAAHGYTFIPRDVLATQYDGTCNDAFGFRTRACRFFFRGFDAV